MKNSKAPLVMMEQMVMLLVFALAAALCLQAFVRSDALSHRSEARDRAITLAQSAAETIRHSGGDMGNALSQTAQALGGDYAQGLLWADYDENWAPLSSGSDGAYRLTAQGVPVETPGLWKAHVQVTEGDETVLFEIDVAWQEVDGNG